MVLDTKSLAVGAFAGAALIAGLGAVQQQEPQIGRFQISAEHSGDAFVVDTATGRVWTDRQATTNAGREFLKPKLNVPE